MRDHYPNLIFYIPNSCEIEFLEWVQQAFGGIMHVLVAVILLAVLAFDILGSLVGRWMRSAVARQLKIDKEHSQTSRSPTFGK